MLVAGRFFFYSPKWKIVDLVDLINLISKTLLSQRTNDLRLTPLKSGLAAQENRGYNDGTSSSPVRVRAVDERPFTQAYSRGYSFKILGSSSPEM